MGLQESLTKDEIKHTIAFAATVFSDDPNMPHFQKQLDAAVARLAKRAPKPRGGRQLEIVMRSFRTFCEADSFICKQCFGHKPQAKSSQYSARERVTTKMLAENSPSQHPRRGDPPRTNSFNATKAR